MEEEKKSKRGLIIGAVAVGVVALGVGAYFLLSGSGGKNGDGVCYTDDTEHEVTDTFPGIVVDPALAQDVTFRVDDFCGKYPVPHDRGVCVAHWQVATLEISSSGGTFNGTIVTINVQYPISVGHSNPVSVSYKIGSGPMSLANPLVLYEGSTASIHLARALAPSDGLKLTLGGLCIVENIDGGDIHGEDPTDRQIEPVIAKTGRDTLKIMGGS